IQGGPMERIARRDFVTGAALGALAFTVAGAEVLLTPKQARAEGVPVRALGARQDGIAHFVDQQLTVPPPHALLSLRVTEVRPPYADFYRAALGGIDHASRALHQR